MDTRLNKPIESVSHSSNCPDRTGLTFFLDEESKQTCLAGRQENQEKTTFQPTALRAPHRFFSPTRMVSTKCIQVIYNWELIWLTFLWLLGYQVNQNSGLN
ncbi:MAG: hypothetical protein ACFCUU_12485 [Cyclobacteriaceae bacterium]